METENHTTGTPDSGGGEYWLDQRKNINLIFWLLVGTCALLVVIQIVMDRYVVPHTELDPSVVPHSELEKLTKWPGFYGAFGYVAFLVIVLAGAYLRKLVMREEDYYVR